MTVKGKGQSDLKTSDTRHENTREVGPSGVGNEGREGF